MHRALIGAVALGWATGCTCNRPPGTLLPPTHPSGNGGDTAVVPPPPTGETGEPLAWVQADMGYIHSCGLLSDGRVVCWGDDECVDVAPAPHERFVQISEGNHGGCHLREDGTLSCMCCGTTGDEICDEVPEGRFVEVRNGSHFACALDEEGFLTCWGDLDSPEIVPPTEPLVDFAMDINGGCGVTAAGEMACFGGLLWGGHLPPEGVKFSRVTTGRRHACGLGLDREIYCWGNTVERTPFPDAPPGPFVDVETFNQISCGIRPDRHVECWYDFPQLHDLDDIPPEADGGPSWTPPDEPFAQLGLGEWDACGATVDGRALCWPALGDTEGEVTELPSLEDL